MTAVFIKILNMSISASWIVLAVMILRLLLKKAPKWITVILWGLVALRLVLPFSIESAFSLIPSSETVNPDIIITTTESEETDESIVSETAETIDKETVTTVVTETTAPAKTETVPPANTTVPPVSYETVPPTSAVTPPIVDITTAESANTTVPPSDNETMLPIGNETAKPVDDETTAPVADDVLSEPDKNNNSIRTAMFVMSIVWLVGIVAMALYTTVSYWVLRKKIAMAVRVRDNVYKSGSIDSPFVLGVIRPKIYLPSDVSDMDAEYVIAHENAHIKRFDHLWKPLGFVLLAVYWFNPVMWIAYVFLCRDIELACDEKVIAGYTDEQRADYSQALLNCSVRKKAITACPIAFGEVGVKDRIKSVLNYKKPALWIIILAVVAIIATALCFLTDPISKKEIEEGTEETEESTKQDPLEILEGLEYKLEKPSEELKNKFAEEYIAYKGYDSKNPPTVAIECWLGSYGDIGFLLVYDSQMKFPTGGTRTERVADSKFDYSYGQSILVWADNQFLSLDEAWRKVIITTRMITKIEEVYKQKQYIEVYDYSTLDPSVTEYRLEMPTRAVRERFAGEYSAYMKTIYPDSNISGYIKCWLGSFGNIGFVWAFEGVDYAQVLTTEVVADSKFEYSDSHTIKVWVDGKFLSITKAYEQNLITKEMVAKIAEAWAKKQFLEVVEGTTPNYPPVLQEPEKQPETPEKFSYASYYEFLIGLGSNNPEKIANFFVKDIDNNGVEELIVDHDNSMEYSFYTIDNGVVKLIEKYDFLTGTTRLLETNDEAYPGLICFTVGGGAEHYVYLTIKDGQLSFEKIWDDNYSGTYDTPTTEYTTDKKLIEVSANAYNKNQDVARTDIALVAVLYSQKPYIDEEGKSVYLKDYKFQNMANMSPEEYTSVDMDNDGENELIVNIAHQDVIYSVMVFRVYNGEVYGYEFVIRALKGIKTDGSFSCSESAFITSTHKLEFEGTSYKVVELEYSNLIDNVYRLNGVNVTKAETETFESEWNKIPKAVWAKWSNTNVPPVLPTADQLTGVEEPFLSVLTGKTTFIDSSYYEMNVSDYFEAWPMIGYTFVDFNQDGQNEIVVEMSGVTFLLLYKNGNSVSGSVYGHRTLGEIYTNGIYAWHQQTGDVLAYGLGTFKFSGSKINQLTLCHIEQNDTAGTVAYYVGEKQVSKEEYDAFYSQNTQQKAVWIKLQENQRDIGQMQTETQDIILIDGKRYQTYVASNADVRYIFISADEYPTPVEWIWDWVAIGTANEYSLELIGKVDEGRIPVDLLLVNYFKKIHEEYKDSPYTAGSYALYDMNGDGTNELLYWDNFHLVVCAFQNGVVKTVYYDGFNAMNGPIVVLENGAILSRNDGTGSVYYYETLNADYTITRIYFDIGEFGEYGNHYNFEGKSVSKEEWLELTKPYFDIPEAPIEWLSLDKDPTVPEHEFYIDVNFDSKLDKLVPYMRPASGVFYKAYVWNEAKGDYVYAEGFENCPNISIDTERKVLLSHRTASMITSYSIITFDGMKFDSNRGIYWEPAENDTKIHFVEKEYIREPKYPWEKFCKSYLEVEHKNVNVGMAGLLTPDKTDEQIKGYFEAGSFWDLDGARWKNYVCNMDTSDWWKF